MGWLDRWLGRRPPSSSQESISEAQLVPVNWVSSQPHLALLQRFLSAREAKNGIPDFWAPAFGLSSQCVIEDMVAHGALEPLPLLEKFDFCYTIVELKKILSSNGLKIGGKKAELVRRLFKADPKGMEKLCAHRMILRCTPAASQAVARWEVECTKAFETATDNVITALRNRQFKDAIRTADAYRKNKFEPPVHPGAVMAIKSAPRSIEERAKNLATVFTMRPKILGRLQPAQWEGLYLNYAVWQLLGRVATKKCMPGFIGIGAMDPVTVTRMLGFHVEYLDHLAEWRELGVKEGAIVCCNAGSCEACMALDKKTYSLDKLPELPYKDCTCGSGCRCYVRPDMDI